MACPPPDHLRRFERRARRLFKEASRPEVFDRLADAEVEELAEAESILEGHPPERPLPPAPTDALPGTPERTRIEAERFRNGYHPTHPADARRGDLDDRLGLTADGRLISPEG